MISQSLQNRTDRTELLEQVCRRHGIPLTVQRRTVFETIAGRTDHPTADQVHESVKDVIPNISRMTVYRVLDWLVRLGIITKVCHPGNTVRFEPNTQQHHHMVCLHCDSLMDVEDENYDSLSLPDTSGTGFKLIDYSIQFRGVCSECRSKLADSHVLTMK